LFLDIFFQQYLPFLSPIRRFLAVWLFWGCFGLKILAQGIPSDSTKNFFVKIDSISFEGLKKTRKSLILRELDIRLGDSIPASELEAAMLRNRNRVVNLQIFNEVVVSAASWPAPDRVHLHIKVREAWYWFPSPVFELVDRNFNVWWKEFDRSLRRTNFGGDYTQKNFTGFADIFGVTATAGYNQRFSIRYITPTINKKQTLGMFASFNYSRTRELAIATRDNKLVFFSDPAFYAVRRFLGDLSLSWRPGLLNFHSLALEYRYHTIADTIANTINPAFFAPGVTKQRHMSLVYAHTFDSRNIRMYPTKGLYTYTEIRQNGLLPTDDLFLTRFRLEVNKYFEFNKRFSLETGFRLRYSLPRSQPPYFNNSALGYLGDIVRGYEYYVMDGLDFGTIKTSVRGKFFDRTLYYPKFIKKRCQRCKGIGTEMYLSVLNDVGYANDPWYGNDNALTNRVLYATGVALDVVFYRRSPFQLAWMRTVTGQTGVFFRTRP
jgi:outer membrane protein assembly factor BamA